MEVKFILLIKKKNYLNPDPTGKEKAEHTPVRQKKTLVSWSLQEFIQSISLNSYPLLFDESDLNPH